MADKFKKVAVPEDAEVSDAEDAWKDALVEREHQPEVQKSNLTYRNMEEDIARIDADLARLEEQKATIEAEMVKVESAAA